MTFAMTRFSMQALRAGIRGLFFLTAGWMILLPLQADFSVATYNIMVPKLYQPYRLCYDLSAKKMDDLARAVRPHDLVGLQEVVTLAFPFLLLDQPALLEQRMPEHKVFWFSNVSGYQYSMGNASCSRFRVLGGRNETLPSLREDSEPRRVLILKVEAEGRPLYFCVTHLSYIKEEAWVQAQALTRMMGRLDLPVILVGDCNVTPDSREYGLLSAVLADAGARRPFPTFDSARPTKRIDYCFYSEKCLELLSCGLLAGTPCDLSDHLGLTARFRWR